VEHFSGNDRLHIMGCHWIRCLGTKRRHRDVFSVGLVQLVGSGNEFFKVEGDVLTAFLSVDCLACFHESHGKEARGTTRIAHGIAQLICSGGKRTFFVRAAPLARRSHGQKMAYLSGYEQRKSDIPSPIVGKRHGLSMAGFG
jgi:hypothetical protein